MTGRRPRWEDQQPGRCWDCGGVCAIYKGSVHGWRCTGCLEVYLDQGWQNWLLLDDKERSRRSATGKPARWDARSQHRAGSPATVNEGRGGGGLATGRTAATFGAPR